MKSSYAVMLVGISLSIGYLCGTKATKKPTTNSNDISYISVHDGKTYNTFKVSRKVTNKGNTEYQQLKPTDWVVTTSSQEGIDTDKVIYYVDPIP